MCMLDGGQSTRELITQNDLQNTKSLEQCAFSSVFNYSNNHIKGKLEGKLGTHVLDSEVSKGN